MNVINYEREMEKIISSLKNKPKLLLHSCCAPCSSSCIERLKEFFDITVYYYNPNMDTLEEFNKRSLEQQRLCETWGINFISEKYDSSEFYSAVKGLETEPECGKRCFKCYRLRLEKTAKKAKELDFNYFTTTLTLSPLKNSQKINEIGLEVEKLMGVKFLPSDFKKKGGYLRSIELSKEFNLYRQNYCGCKFSKRV